MYAYMTIVFTSDKPVQLAKVNWMIEDGVLKTWVDVMSRRTERRYFPLHGIQEIRVADE